MRKIRCSTRRRDTVSVIEVQGELTARTQGQLHGAVLGEQLRGATEVVLDLTRVRYFDSVGMTGVLGVQRLGRVHGCTVHLRGLEEAASRLLQLEDLVPDAATAPGPHSA